jgi:lysophospholipid acyltransferase (LPLAT)-like uncharacterized protein
MSPIKRLLRSDVLQNALCCLGAAYIRLVHTSGNWRTVRGEIPRRFWDDGKPFILCFWHGRLLMMPLCWDHQYLIHMLISQHRDGQIIARTVGHFGILTVAGSSSRGGAQALRAMVRALKSGKCIGITPDGPRGPRMRASDGIISVARLAGVPIIPATFSAVRGALLTSWDRFLVAAPLSRGVIVWGEPIEVARDADAAALEHARRQVEDGLNAITAEADGLLGREPVEPDEAAA